MRSRGKQNRASLRQTVPKALAVRLRLSADAAEAANNRSSLHSSPKRMW